MLRRIFSSGCVWLWLAILVIGLDRYSKIWVSDHLMLGEPLNVLPFFNLTLAYNTGAAFSFLHSASGWQNVFLGGLAVVVSFVILFNLFQSSVREYAMGIALSLVLGGALGNAWDRLLYGHVIDFFDVYYGDWHFAIFNVADSAICVGAFVLCLHWMLQAKKD